MKRQTVSSGFQNAGTGTFPVIIVAKPLGRSRFDAMAGDRVLVASTKQPLLDGARALLAEGADPSQRVVTRHAGSDVDALISTIGAAAKLTVQETDRGGPYFRLWKPFLSLDVRPSVVFEDDPLGRSPPATRSSPGGAR